MAPPRLDGRLDDACWAGASFISGFTQKDPEEGAPSRFPTEVAFLYDAQALYVGARLGGEEPGSIRTTMGRRDEPGNSERIIVSLDTHHDRRTAYSFAVTASGVRVDYSHSSDEEYDRDYQFDPVWEARTARDSLGWTAEMRIPFSQLRFQAADTQVWGVNFNRWTPVANEDSYWVLIPKNETGWASRFGEVRGISGIRPSRRLEVAPYLATRGRYRSASDPQNPFEKKSDYDGRAGGDLKLGLGPNLTLEATVNPDFGQVEADPAEVNLTAYETFFTEKRPFFTEGAALLRGPGPGYFYSRRIGAPPRGAAPGDYEDRPEATTILGAAKVSGRLARGLSLAALGAVTDREHARSYDTATGGYARTEVAPRSGYGAVRLQQEFGKKVSTVGLCFATVVRDVDPGGALAEAFTRKALTGGTDWDLWLAGGKYKTGGYLGGSYVAGDTAAVERVQTSSVHYLQRPDAKKARFDPSRTSLSGYTAGWYLVKKEGRHWLWGAGDEAESPGLELNDAGQLNSADDLTAWTYLTYRENTPGRLWRTYSVTLRPEGAWNFDGIRRFRQVGCEIAWTWPNFLSSSLDVGRYLDGMSDESTRGGPLMRDPAGDWLTFSLSSNFARNTQWQLSGWNWRDDLGSGEHGLEASWSARPGGRLQLSLAPEYERERNRRQYVTALDGPREEVFHHRYIFAAIERSTLSLEARARYAFTPDLTFDLYAEPFAASGRYADYGELARPGASDLRFYGQDGTTVARGADGSLTVTDGPDIFTLPNEDFRYLSLRVSAVLRWEWRRGSTLYLVWQQNRAETRPIGDFVGPGELWDTLGAEGENLLALKVSYWLPVR